MTFQATEWHNDHDATHYAYVEYYPVRARPRLSVRGSYNQVCEFLRKHKIDERDFYKYIQLIPQEVSP